METGTIVVIGSSNTDLVIKANKLPSPSETILGGQFFKYPGGKGANQAVAAARAGGEVIFIGKIGNDIFGDEAIRNLRNDGINTDYVIRDDANPSGIALIVVDEKGENLITVAPGSNNNLQPSEIESLKEILQEARIVLLQMEIPFKTILSTISLAAKLRIPVILNPAPAPDQKIPSNILVKIGFITPNKTELANITTNLGYHRNEPSTKTDIMNRAKSLIELGVQNVIVTLGVEGSLLINQNELLEIPAFRVQAIDTTAAGDCFNGSLAVALVEGKTTLDAIRFASAAAAISVTRMGAQPSLPFRSEIDEKLIENY